MENENSKKYDPSTSKKDSRSNNSTDDSRGDQVKHRDRSESDSYTTRSSLNKSGIVPIVPVSLTMKKTKRHVKKKGTQQLKGRVKKPDRPSTKRQRRVVKRKPKVKQQKKEKDISVSTIFTRLSSSGYRTPGCDHCGHRCCRRRYGRNMRNKYIRNVRDKIRKSNRYVKRKRVYNKREQILRISEGYQAGSRSNMLSPLFISSNSAPEANQRPSVIYCEITPEMIYDSLRKLTMWRQDVPTNSILEYIIRNYPVNKDKEELLIDLSEKLTIAAIVGIIARTSNDTWGFSHAFQKRRLARNHVTLFWKTYADTLRPVAKKTINTIQQQDKKKTSQNEKNMKETKLNTITIYNEEYI